MKAFANTVTTASVGFLAMAVPASAHHVMGGAMPSSFSDGLLSGLGHPLIGLDHLAFLIVVGLAVGMAVLHWAMPIVFVAASMLGVAVHLAAIDVPRAELLVAATVIIGGALIASGTIFPRPIWAALFVVGGLLHGYAFGESIVGAEQSPLVAYLLGLALMQSVLAIAVAVIVRRGNIATLHPRLAGAAIGGAGLAILVNQLLPA